ncbi:hypothetical protein B1B08_12525 (plasmid) [Cutibacterium acnes subsp. defendens]|nr:hypothetical protein [Cutibacterium acnes]PGF24156.1 hypothetical protein B1B08_12525 [Cutibacterium acnes subsp. defendens]
MRVGAAIWTRAILRAAGSRVNQPRVKASAADVMSGLSGAGVAAEWTVEEGHTRGSDGDIERVGVGSGVGVGFRIRCGDGTTAPVVGDETGWGWC